MSKATDRFLYLLSVLLFLGVFFFDAKITAIAAGVATVLYWAPVICYRAWRRKLDGYNEDGTDLYSQMSNAELLDALPNEERVTLADGRVVCRVGEKLYERIKSPLSADLGETKYYAKDITPRRRSDLSVKTTVGDDLYERVAHAQLAQTLEGEDLLARVITTGIVHDMLCKSDFVKTATMPLRVYSLDIARSLLTPEALAVYDTQVKSTLIEVNEPIEDSEATPSVRTDDERDPDFIRRVYPVVFMALTAKCGADELMKDKLVLATRVMEAAQKIAQTVNWGVKHGVFGHGTLCPISYLELASSKSPLERWVTVFCFMGLGKPAMDQYLAEEKAAREAWMAAHGVTQAMVDEYNEWYYKRDDEGWPMKDFREDPLKDMPRFPVITEWVNTQTGGFLVPEGYVGTPNELAVVPTHTPAWSKASEE